MIIGSVLVFRGVDRLFDYVLTDDIAVGTHLILPFGRFTVEGVLIEKMEVNKCAETKLKPIKDICFTKPVLSKKTIDLMMWFSQYYQTTPYKAYQTVVGRRKVLDISKGEAKLNSTYSLDFVHSLDQQMAIKTILSKLGAYLLFGVTASGKTEVYLSVIEQLLSKGESVLYLIPEIALTPQILQQVTQRFGDQACVVHSGMTAKQRNIVWHRVYQGESLVVIGPRSALFMPFHRLGLIVVDEEHDASFKQDSHPRYLSHKVIEKVSLLYGCRVIFGSATPDLETYYRFSQKPENCLSMASRVTGKGMPKVTVVDMTDEAEFQLGQSLCFSLQNAIEKTLKKGLKVMILVNRRGFSTYIYCQACQSPFTCSSCGLSYTYHHDRTFHCHRCDDQRPLNLTCQKCGSKKLQFSGVAIQKVETELKQQFEGAKIYRLDKDVATTSRKVESILKSFKKDGDILVGTQLIAKGHHIPSVHLVGVVGLDTTLNLPDYLSTERTFQLLTQVAGRAGRGDVVGQVVVQTQYPDHYAIQAAAKHDYLDFYDQEIAFRESLGYPPFRSLINLIFSSLSLSDLKRYAYDFSDYMSSFLDQHSDLIQMIGPKPAPFELIRKHHRWNVLFKCDYALLDDFKFYLGSFRQSSSVVRMMMDFDCKSVL